MHAPVTDARQVQRIFLAVGAVGIVASVYMAWKFGSSISNAHGVALVTACIVAAFIFPARKLLNPGKTGSAVLMVAGTFFVALEFMSHLGYTFGMRERQQVEASAQTNVHQIVNKSLKSEETNLALWRDQLSKLQAENAWAATVNPDGLKSELDTLRNRIEEEKKGKRGRKAGCGQECERLQNAANALEARIAIASKADDLSKRIEATQRVLDTKVNTATTTKTGHSTVKAQQDSFAQLLLLASGTDAEEALNPNEVAKNLADKFIGFLMAIGATALPSIAFYIAFFGAPAIDLTTTQARRPMPTVPSIPAPTHHQDTQIVEVVVQQEPAQAKPAPTTELDFHPVNAVARRKTTAFAQRCAAIADHHVQKIAMVRSAA
jgi:hypothetical protein